MRDGKPVLASSTIGAGLHEVQLQNLVNYIDFDLTADASVLVPNFYTPDFNITFAPYLHLQYPTNQLFLNGTFPSSVLEQVSEMGQGIVCKKNVCGTVQ